MAIQQPGPRLCASIPLSFIRKNQSGKKKVDAQITLIPFIDFLLTIVVFLLMSFSATGEIPVAAAELPEAEHGVELQLAPVVSVDASLVTVDGHRVADTPSLMSDARLSRIEGLVTNLETARRTWEMLHPNEHFSGRVVLQIDRAVDYRVVRKVLFSAAQAGYTDMDFAVRPAE